MMYRQLELCCISTYALFNRTHSGTIELPSLRTLANILVLLTLRTVTVYVSLCIDALLLYCTTISCHVHNMKTTVIKYFNNISAVLCFTQNAISVSTAFVKCHYFNWFCSEVKKSAVIDNARP